jgi:hypothetical protein
VKIICFCSKFLQKKKKEKKRKGEQPPFFRIQDLSDLENWPIEKEREGSF